MRQDGTEMPAPAGGESGHLISHRGSRRITVTVFLVINPASNTYMSQPGENYNTDQSWVSEFLCDGYPTDPFIPSIVPVFIKESTLTVFEPLGGCMGGWKDTMRLTFPGCRP